MTGLFIAVDIETTGPVPAFYEMLQLGAVAMLDTGEHVDEFSINIRSEQRRMHPETQKFWDQHRKAFDAARRDTEDLGTAIRFYDRWVRKNAVRVWGPNYEKQGHVPVFVAWPANFDWQFVAHAFEEAGRPNPHGSAAVDIRSMLNGFLGYGDNYGHNPDIPTWMSEGLEYEPYQHDALADARYQAHQFGRLLKKMRLGNHHVTVLKEDLQSDRQYVREQVEVLRAIVGLPPGAPTDTITGWWRELHTAVRQLHAVAQYNPYRLHPPSTKPYNGEDMIGCPPDCEDK